MPKKYLPFLNGRYTTAPGLRQMQRGNTPEDQLIFQIDNEYDLHIQNKQRCRKENIRKYYCEQDMKPETIIAVNRFIVNQLIKEHPDVFQLKAVNNFDLKNHKTGASVSWNKYWILNDFSSYTSLFDALCCQVQEDLAIWQLNDKQDWLAAIHLCAPNHWAAADKIGKPFHLVHQPVPEMERTMRNYRKLLESMITQSPVTRFGWGISTDKRLNHHPEAPCDKQAKIWQGRRADKKQPQFFIRVERQNFVGFPDVNAFLFTIRTYFYNVKAFDCNEKEALKLAVLSMSDATLRYKGLMTLKLVLLKTLEN